MTSKTPRPRRKVLGAAFTGALVTLTVFVLNTYVISGQDKKITSEASAAATTVLSSLIAYLIPPDPNETTVDEDGNTKSALKQWGVGNKYPKIEIEIYETFEMINEC